MKKEDVAMHPGKFWFVFISGTTSTCSTEALLKLLEPFKVWKGPFDTALEAEDALEDYWWVPPMDDDN